MPTPPFEKVEEEWFNADSEDLMSQDGLDDAETLEFSPAEDEEETTWEWDGSDWKRV